MSDTPVAKPACAICAFAKEHAFYLVAAVFIAGAWYMYRKQQEMNKEA